MNSNICLVTIIMLLSLENVAGCLSSWSKTPSQQQRPPTEKPEDKHDLKGYERFTCSSPKMYHQWHQDYQNGSPEIAIGNIPPQDGVKTTRFIIKVEQFDNNTEIYCENLRNDPSTDKSIRAWRIQVVNSLFAKVSSYLKFDSKNQDNNEFFLDLRNRDGDKTHKENEEPTILKYNEKQNVSFSCLEHIKKTTHIQSGLINTSSNLIKTFEEGTMHKALNVTHNGTILCCVYYVVNETAEEKWITRFVANKTLLLYDNIVRQETLGSKEIILGNNTCTDAPADPGNQNSIIITISAVAAVFILLVVIVICKKRCRKKPESNIKVLYADLDLPRRTEPDSFPRPDPEEESPYAQIIGEMRPQTK